MHDFKISVLYNLSFPWKSKDKLSAQIMLLMHALEKGMSFTDSAREFGKDKAVSLARLIDKYLDKYKIDDTCVVAINVLHEYLKNINSTKDSKSRELINKVLAKHSEVVKDGFAGTKTVCEPPVFDKISIEQFFSTRSSVRNYSDVPVSDEEIKSALHIASYTPSACNRQTSRVHVFRDRDKMKEIIDNQLGNQNWCDNATILFLVTVNISYFGGVYERHQGLIDGGLYSMNFVHGLHLNHVASCFKMFVRGVKIEREFRKITRIPENEIPIVLILAGHYKTSPVTSPMSVRVPFDS